MPLLSCDNRHALLIYFIFILFFCCFTITALKAEYGSRADADEIIFQIARANTVAFYTKIVVNDWVRVVVIHIVYCI